jgi:hypothetical protein
LRGNAQATPPLPAALLVRAHTPTTGLSGAAVPDVLAQSGSPITLTVSTQPEGTVFPVDTPLQISVTLASGGAASGMLTPATVTMPAGETGHDFTVSYSGVDNGVVAHVEVATPDPMNPVAAAQSDPFDVVKTLAIVPSTDARLQTGIGIGNRDCLRGTREVECARFILPNGVASDDAAFSLGRCTADLGCTPGSEVVQFIADLGDRYTAEHPATMVIRCAKALCRGSGVTHYAVRLSFDPSGPLDLTSEPCLTAGVALDSAGHDYCTDYAASRRDAGDLLLVIRFRKDMRGST